MVVMNDATRRARAGDGVAGWFAGAQDALTAQVRRPSALRAAEAVTSWLFVTIRRACLRRAPGAFLVPTGVAGDLAGADLAGGVADRVVAVAGLVACRRRSGR
jgi:hypothetical protein